MKNKEKIELALKNLRDGKIIIVSDDKNRENEGDLICAAYLHANIPKICR